MNYYLENYFSKKFRYILLHLSSFYNTYSNHRVTHYKDIPHYKRVISKSYYRIMLQNHNRTLNLLIDTYSSYVKYVCDYHSNTCDLLWM